MKKHSWKRWVWILVSGAVLCALLWACVFSKGRVAAYFFPLPHDVPETIIVLDADTAEPITGAQVRAEWWCHDNPLPDGPGSFTVMSEAATNEEGRAGLSVPHKRGGWFGCSTYVEVSMPGYVPLGIIVEPADRPLPESVATWPFRTTVTMSEFPDTVLASLKPALPVYLTALVDDDAFIRAVAAEELGALEPVLTEKRDELIVALTDALDDPDVSVRKNAARSLGIFAEDACGSISAIAELVSDGDEWVRLEAVETLGFLIQAGCPPADETVAALTRALSDEFSWVRREAARGLGYAGIDGIGALDALTRALEDDDSLVQEYAAEAIEYIEDADR